MSKGADLTPIQVVGVGLDGLLGLSETVQRLVKQATLLVGSDRHLSYFPEQATPRFVLGDLREAIARIRDELSKNQGGIVFENSPLIVILTSGDPLFFGFGRLLLTEFESELLTFHPQVSSVQLAFNRIKVSWQDARLISAHGRSLEALTQSLQQGASKIAVLTDDRNTPGAIAHLLLSLELPGAYRCWVCENLGGTAERVQCFTPEELTQQSFEPLNVVILLRTAETIAPVSLPLLGLPDSSFLSFGDRPGLMTKREVRLLALGELGLYPDQTVWDVGAGTGSVSIEIARLCPTSKIYAVEKTAAGVALIEQNQQRFQVENVSPVHGTAPGALAGLPAPDRIFIGGSGSFLTEILEACCQVLRPEGVMVVAIATLENLAELVAWGQTHAAEWTYRMLQIQVARSVPVGDFTRFAPQNPVTLVRVERAWP
jgi:precorrin-6Y C5,15-methyltransferase (decarboxylating)